MSKRTRRSLFEVKTVDEITVTTFTNRSILDQKTVNKVGKEIFDLANKYDHPKIVLNFSNVAFLSVAMLPYLMTLNKKIFAKGGKLAMCHVSDQVLEVFERTGWQHLFTIKKDEQAALECFKPLPPI